MEGQEEKYVLVCPVCNSREVYPVTDVASIDGAFQTFYHCNHCGFTSQFFVEMEEKEASKLEVKEVDLEKLKGKIIPVVSTNNRVIGWTFKTQNKKVVSTAFNLAKLIGLMLLLFLALGLLSIFLRLYV
ncbi:MAG: hypothetical protein J7K98_04185 [Candidatus Aenigmarchaeota archaeon]|nr:hypothetical protein [Candidatus Aenigmarchaeota archaeon]